MYAGDVYNTAVYLKRSLPAAQVRFLTATGDDAMSGAMRYWRSQLAAGRWLALLVASRVVTHAGAIIPADFAAGAL